MRTLKSDSDFPDFLAQLDLDGAFPWVPEPDRHDATFPAPSSDFASIKLEKDGFRWTLNEFPWL
jgi:hypothetical protein